MAYRFYQENSSVLTTKGYTELAVLDEKDKLVSFDPKTGAYAEFPVISIQKTPREETGHQVTTSDISIPTYLPKSTLIYCVRNGMAAYIPVSVLIRKEKVVSLYRIQQDILSVIPFEGIVEIWNEVYRVPVNQTRKAYNEGTRLLGVSPLVLYNQLGKEEKGKFFRGLLKTTEEERDRLSLLMCRHKATVDSPCGVLYEFRCAADGFNFQSLYSYKHKTSVLCQISRNGKVKVVRVRLNKKKPVSLDGVGCAAVNVRNNYCKHIRDTEILLETEAPTLILNTFVIKQ